MILLVQSLLVVLYALCVFSLGVFLLRLLLPGVGREDFPVGPLPLTASCLLVGQGVLGFVWLGLALGGWLAPKVIIVLLLLGLLGGGRAAHRLAGRTLASAGRLLAQCWRLPWPWVIVLVMVLAMLACLGLTNLAGPVRVGSDASAFYMVLPKVVAASHKLTPTADYVLKHSTFGLMGEMHFAALMSLGAATASKGITFVTGLALMALLAGLAARAGLARRGQLITCLILISSTGITNYICDGKVDVYSAAFGIAAVYWVLAGGSLPRHRAAILAGLLLGWGIYSKLSLLVCLAPPLALLYLWRQQQSDGFPGAGPAWLGRRIGGLVLLGACALLPVLVLMLKNQLLFQEPFAPVFWFSKSWGTWFAARRYTPADVQHLLALYPLALVLGKFHAQSGQLSPLVLLLTPLLLLAPRPDRWRSNPLFQLGLAGLLGLIIWVAVFPRGIGVRFIFPTLLLFVPLAARGAEQVLALEPAPRWVSRALWPVLWLVPLFTLVAGYHYFLGPAHFWAKMNDPAYQGRSHAEGPHPVLVTLGKVNRLAKPGDRVLMLMMYRYWLDPRLLQCLPSESEWQTLLQQKTPSDAWRYLFNRGIKFVVLDAQTHAPFIKLLGIKGPGAPGAPAWLEVERVSRQGRWSVYRLAARQPGRKPAFVCGQPRPPAWRAVPNP